MSSHYLDPKLDKAHVALFYRNSLKYALACHVGLGVGAMHTVKVLRQNRIRADSVAVNTVDEVRAYLQRTPSVSHAIIEAPWVSTSKVQDALDAFPGVHFVVRSHSEVGFLQADPGAVQYIREQMLLAEGALNLSVASNSPRLTHFLRTTHDARVLHLPNLYDLRREARKRDEAHHHRELRISSFGALRAAKNHATAAAAALMIARERGADLRFFVNVNRNEGGGSVLDSLRALFRGLTWAELVEVPWAAWPEFRRTVREMDLALQLSTTESFNLTTADAVAAGVPGVVTHAIEWAPESWKVGADDLRAATRVGSALLSSRTGAAEGLEALERYARNAVDVWLRYLAGAPDEQR